MPAGYRPLCPRSSPEIHVRTRCWLDSRTRPGKTVVVPVVQVRSIILGALGALIVLVFFKLVLDSQGRKPAEVDQAELEKALSEYRRNEATASARNSTPTVRTPVRRAKTAAKPAVDTDEGETSRTRKPFVAPPPLPETEPDDELEAKARMDGANQLYDRADYEGAREAALALLTTDGNNVRMKRIVVSSSCIMGDADVASQHFGDLPPRDQRQMARRCKRYGIEFDEQDQ